MSGEKQLTPRQPGNRESEGGAMIKAYLTADTSVGTYLLQVGLRLPFAPNKSLLKWIHLLLIYLLIYPPPRYQFMYQMRVLKNKFLSSDWIHQHMSWWSGGGGGVDYIQTTTTGYVTLVFSLVMKALSWARKQEKRKKAIKTGESEVALLVDDLSIITRRNF